MKRYFAFLLAIVCCLPCFAGCGKHTKLTIIEESACNILYDATQLTEDHVKNFANRIEKATGATVTLQSTAEFPLVVYAQANTILLGAVAIEDCTAALADLRNRDYVVGVYGQYYVIAGKDADATVDAMEYFRKSVLPEKEVKKLTVNSKNNYHYTGKYDLNNVTIGGKALGECEIVIPNNASVAERSLAIEIQKFIALRAGYDLPIVIMRKAGAEGQIRVGASICTDVNISTAHSFDIKVLGTVMQVAAESFYGYEAARVCFKDEILSGTKDTYAIDNTLAYSGNGADRATEPLDGTGEVRLLFNNIWGGSTGDTEQRTNMLLALYGEYLPDVIGLQECSPSMRVDGMADIVELGYTEVPVNPSLVTHYDETQVRTPLFYREETLEMLAHGYKALNTLEFWSTEYQSLLPSGVTSTMMKSLVDQDKYGPDEDGSKGITWAIFRVKATGHVFMVGSTHLWWQGRNASDDAARIIQMDVMKRLVTSEAAAFMSAAELSGEMPIFIGGDYNTRSSRESYTTMSWNVIFDDINRLVSPDMQLTESTCHDYPTYDDTLKLWTGMGSPNGDYGNSLDYIFANRTARDTYEITHIGMLEEDFAFLTSDHSPIFVDLNFTGAAPLMAATP